MDKEELFSISITKPEERYRREAKEVFDSLAKPLDGFGEFEDMICRIAAIRGERFPDTASKTLIVMCADNGVTAEGVTQTGSEVTAAVAALLGKGRSTANFMAKAGGIRVMPVDIGTDTEGEIEGVINARIRRSTGNIRVEPAMTAGQCLSAIASGIDIVRECSVNGTDILAAGEMGIGNTTTSAALFCALTGSAPEEIAGRGAGLSDEGLAKKITVISDSLKLHGLDKLPADGITKEYALEALRRVGGLDIAGLCGIYIGASIFHIPVVIDGAISAAAALAAFYILPGCEDFMLASHSGREVCTGRALEILGLKGVIEAGMALGEGTGALMLFPLLDMVMSVYRNGTSFEGSGIRKYTRFEK